MLAVERRTDLLIVDERRGRRKATAEGLEVTGLIGADLDAEVLAARGKCRSLCNPLNLQSRARQ